MATATDSARARPISRPEAVPRVFHAQDLHEVDPRYPVANFGQISPRRNSSSGARCAKQGFQVLGKEFLCSFQLTGNSSSTRGRPCGAGELGYGCQCIAVLRLVRYPLTDGTRRMGRVDHRTHLAQRSLYRPGLLQSNRNRGAVPTGEKGPAGSTPARSMDRHRRAGNPRRDVVRSGAAGQSRQLAVEPQACRARTLAATWAGQVRTLWCGRVVPKTRGRNVTFHRYYYCHNHDPLRAGGEHRRCPERNIRADELDTFVFEQLRDTLFRRSKEVQDRKQNVERQRDALIVRRKELAQQKACAKGSSASRRRWVSALTSSTSTNDRSCYA